MHPLELFLRCLLDDCSSSKQRKGLAGAQRSRQSKASDPASRKVSREKDKLSARNRSQRGSESNSKEHEMVVPNEGEVALQAKPGEDNKADRAAPPNPPNAYNPNQPYHQPLSTTTPEP